MDRPRIGDITTNDVLATLREIYRDDPEPCDRETLLLSLRNDLGFPALGKRIREALSSDIRAAVRRGILEPRGGKYHLLCGTIRQYEPAFLREMFLA